jgi:Flp pilus assembly protein TadD
VSEDAELHLALGLNLVRQGRNAEALAETARAAEIAPENPRYAYVHGIALISTGQVDEALAVLAASQATHPTDRDTLLALVTINRDAGRIEAALHWAELLVAVDPQARVLRDTLSQMPSSDP